MSRPPACDYVELRCRSAFSFLEASSNPEDLVEAAAERGHSAIALADRDGLYGIPRFHQAARAAGLRAIVGAELAVEADAQRVESWIGEAVSSGAKIVTGGPRRGTLHPPTILCDVDPKQRISCEELFGPAVAITPFNSFDEAIALANGTNYGLAASIFTQDIDRALRFAREVDAGNLHVNWGTQWRADLMPYGGFKGSGIGKEGPRSAVEEMTELKTIIFHGLDG